MKDTSITFRLKQSQKEKLEQISKEKGIPMSQMIRTFIFELIEKENKKGE